MNDTSYETLPTKFGRQTAVPNRLLIVPDINVFFDSPDDPVWSEDRIREVMSWSDVALAQPRWNRLIIASPQFTMEQYVNDGFLDSWQGWFNRLPDNGHYNWLLYHNLQGATTRFGRSDTSATFLASGTIYGGIWLAVNQYMASPDIVWMDILRRTLGNTRFPGWYDADQSHNTKPLAQRFADGDTVIKVNSLYGEGNTIAQVYIVERGRGDDIVAKAYVLPRSLNTTL